VTAKWLVVAAFALGLPAAGHAQQAAMPLLGYLSGRSPEDTPHLLAAFRKGLGEHGFIENHNLAIEYRWANGDYERLPALAGELASRPLAVLAATGGEPAAVAARRATTAIPIVFIIGSDPVKVGLASSYNQPGGNATGVTILTTTLEAKRLGVLHDLVPRAATIGFLTDLTGSRFPVAQSQLREAEAAARSLGLRIQPLPVSTDADIDAAFKTIARQRIQALAVAASPFFDTRREKLIALAARQRVPAIYSFREFAASGGLASYGVDIADAYRQVGSYVGRVLKGAKPAELPVMQPTRFELVINLKTARTLGLAVPSPMLQQADEVIQ